MKYNLVRRGPRLCENNLLCILPEKRKLVSISDYVHSRNGACRRVGVALRAPVRCGR